MAGLRCGGRRKAALIAFVLGVLTLSLIPPLAIQPRDRSPDSGSPMIYTGLRPDWVRLPPVPPVPPVPSPAATQAAPPATEQPEPTPAPAEPPPAVEAPSSVEPPAPTETIAIAGVAAPVEVLPSATAATPPTASATASATASPTASPAPPPALTAAQGLDLAFAEAIFALINEERLANGLNPLAQDPALAAAAREYADLHAHVSPNRLDHRLNGSTIATRTEAEGYTGWAFLAENLVWCGFDPPLSPEEAVRQWLDSPAHRGNILNPAVDETGVGCYVGGGERPFRICVQDFGARR